jgi:hypothetical protein
MPTVEDMPTMPPACNNASDSAEFFPEPGSESLLACINVPLGTPGVPGASDKIEVFPEPGSGSLLAYIDVPITCSRVTYAWKLAQDIRAMEASFRLAKIKGLQDN